MVANQEVLFQVNMASERTFNGLALKIGPLKDQKGYKLWSKEVGAVASTMGIDILRMGSIHAGVGQYGNMLQKAGKERVHVVKDPKDKNKVLFQIRKDSLKKGMKQVKQESPDQHSHWNKFTDKEKVRRWTEWHQQQEKGTQGDQKSEDNETIFSVDLTTGVRPSLKADQSYEVATEFGTVRYASGDQRWMESGEVFFDKVTGLMEDDKGRKSRIALWELMEASLVGSEVVGMCKMCPIQGDIAYVYTKVRDWAERVNVFYYLNSLISFITTENTEWMTADALLYYISQGAEEMDRMGAALKMNPCIGQLRLVLMISQLTRRFQGDLEEVKYLRDISTRLHEAQMEKGEEFTPEKLAAAYTRRATLIRDMGSGLGTTASTANVVANVANAPVASGLGDQNEMVLRQRSTKTHWWQRWPRWASRGRRQEGREEKVVAAPIMRMAAASFLIEI